MTTFQAQWIFPISAPPLERGSITIHEDRIVSTQPADKATIDEDLGNVAILPGLINSHVHLDLSGLRDKAPPHPDFTGWLREVIQHRLSLNEENIENDVRAGLQESIASGVTLLCDIAGQGLSWNVLAEAPIRAITCYEVLGLPEERANVAWTNFEAWAQDRLHHPTCRIGISPHAPYSTSRSLYERATKFAHDHNVLLTSHLAETREELELLENHVGPFREFLESLNVWNPENLARSPKNVLELCQEARTLFAHGNYLERRLFSSQASVVYCPRTHARFQHGRHPIREMLHAGTRIVLGTDSLASNPDLDLLAEARFLRENRNDIEPKEILPMITLWSAEALGWSDEVGSLDGGKSADLVVLPLQGSSASIPEDLILQSQARPQAVMCRGRWIHR